MAASAFPGALVLSLDFELFWGVRDKRSIEDYGPQILGAREAIPEILDLFEAYGVHATWATVGMLFMNGRDELESASPNRRPGYADQQLSSYERMDELGADEAADPYHFAPSIIRRIAATPGQEIGTHTFSHYYCLEPGQTPEQFEADLAAALRVARQVGLSVSSLVFPRNQYDERYLQIAERLGIRAFRGNEQVEMYQPGAGAFHGRWSVRMLRILDAYVNLSGNHTAPYPEGRAGLLDIPSSRLLRPYARRLRLLEPLKRRRIYAGMDEAAQTGRIFHLWWHPHNFGIDKRRNLELLRRVLERYRALERAYGMVSLNMGEVVQLVSGEAADAPAHVLEEAV